MRLNKTKGRQQNNKLLIKKQSNHLKSTSMDNIASSSRTKNIYLNKILQKNLGNNKMPLKDNIEQNFHSSIRNIFSNDERRQKAKNYVLNLRSKNNNQSQLDDDFISKTKNLNFDRLNYGEFYNKKQNLRKTYEILDVDNDNDFDNYNYYRSSQKERPVNMKNMLDNSSEIKDRFIKVNKINKYNDEIRYFEESNNTYNKKNNIITATKQALNKNYINYNTNLENNYSYLNPQNDINMNYSGYNNLGHDLESEYNHDDKNNIRQNEFYDEGFKYNIEKSPTYYYEKNKTKNSKENTNHKTVNKSKTNNNFNIKPKKVLYSKNTNINQKTFTKFNLKSEKKEEKNKNNSKVFNNLKIEKNRLIFKSKNKKVDKGSFKQLVSVSINKFNIKGNYHKKNTNINKETEKLITDLRNTIKNQKKEIDSKTKEILKYKNNNNINNSNEHKKLIETQKNYENIIKLNNKLNEEKKNYIKEINKLKENLNKIKSEQIVDQKLKQGFNKLQKDYDNIDDEYKKLKEKIDIVINENQIYKEENKKLNDTIIQLKAQFSELNKLKNKFNTLEKEKNNVKEKLDKIILENEKYKKEVELKNEQNKNLNIELEKLKEDIKIFKENDNKDLVKNNEEKNNLEKIKDENTLLKANVDKLSKENKNISDKNEEYVKQIEKFVKEREIENNQKQKFIQENQELQNKLNELITKLQKEKDELVQNINFQEKYNQLMDEFNSFKSSEINKYNILLEEKNKLTEEINTSKEELNKLKNENSQLKENNEKIILENKNLNENLDELKKNISHQKSENNNNITNENTETNLNPDKNNNIKPKEEITFPEPVIIKRNEKRRPSKFKKGPIPINKSNIKVDEIKDNSPKSDFQQKLNMFNNKQEEKNEIKEEKSVKFNEEEEQKNKIKEEEKNKLKEQKMSKALQRLKKDREKKNQSQNNEINNNNFNEVKFKSMKIKNMAEILESHMHNKDDKDKDIEENNDLNKEENPFEHMTKLLENRDSKVINKKKMTKKIFEE